jgi:hypothetical protein
MKTLKFVTAILLISILLTSCNLFPSTPQPTGAAPNLTLTALFNTNLNIPPTVTPPAVVAPTIELPTVSVPTVAPTNTSPAATATTSVPPTATQVPPTATLAPKERAGSQMQAGFLSDAPIMDGSYEEWLDQTYKYKLPYVVWGAKNWKDAADLEGAYAAGWDNDYLYVSVKVTDDKYVQNATGALLYEGDSIELLIDTNLLGDFYAQYLDNDDFQLGFSAGKKTTNIDENYLWYPKGSAGSKSKIKMASMFETGSVYRIEVAIPWSLLGVTPSKGMRLGFAVSINDNDDSTKNVQQTMLSTAQFRNFLDPTTWGELVLVK